MSDASRHSDHAGALWPEPRKKGAGGARVREAAVSLDDDVETARASEGARHVPDAGVGRRES